MMQLLSRLFCQQDTSMVPIPAHIRLRWVPSEEPYAVETDFGEYKLKIRSSERCGYDFLYLCTDKGDKMVRILSEKLDESIKKAEIVYAEMLPYFAEEHTDVSQ